MARIFISVIIDHIISGITPLEVIISDNGHLLGHDYILLHCYYTIYYIYHPQVYMLQYYPWYLILVRYQKQWEAPVDGASCPAQSLVDPLTTMSTKHTRTIDTIQTAQSVFVLLSLNASRLAQTKASGKRHRAESSGDTDSSLSAGSKQTSGFLLSHRCRSTVMRPIASTL